MRTRLLYVFLLIGPVLFSSCKTTENSSRKTFDFNWKFALGDFPKASEPDFDDATWRTLNVPHDFSIEHPFDSKNATNSGGGFAYSGIGWYRKNFTLDKSIVNKKVFVLFEGIYRNSEVWINGHHPMAIPLFIMI